MGPIDRCGQSAKVQLTHSRRGVLSTRLGNIFAPIAALFRRGPLTISDERNRKTGRLLHLHMLEFVFVFISIELLECFKLK